MQRPLRPGRSLAAIATAFAVTLALAACDDDGAEPTPGSVGSSDDRVAGSGVPSTDGSTETTPAPNPNAGGGGGADGGAAPAP
jgi:hypothetical protein